MLIEFHGFRGRLFGKSVSVCLCESCLLLFLKMSLIEISVEVFFSTVSDLNRIILLFNTLNYELGQIMLIQSTHLRSFCKNLFFPAIFILDIKYETLRKKVHAKLLNFTKWNMAKFASAKINPREINLRKN